MAPAATKTNKREKRNGQRPTTPTTTMIGDDHGTARANLKAIQDEAEDSIESPATQDAH
jgi:hypothetical protein